MENALTLVYNRVMAYLYQICFPNGKFYIGLTVNPTKRWKKHKALSRMGDMLPVYQAMRKYGIGNLKFEILKEGELGLIKKLEMSTIKKKKTCIPVHGKGWGYNVSLGGDTGPNLHGENHPRFGVKIPKEEHHMWGKHHTLETREKIRLSTLANPSRGMLGKTHSPETRMKQSLRKVGRTLTPEHRAKLGNRGTKNSSSKLNEKKVRAIRLDPRSHTEVAKVYGVSSVLIGKVRKRTSWAWLD